MSNRLLSIVVFDVNCDSEEYDTEDVLGLLFGRTGPVQLQDRWPVTYQSGDYEKDGGVWTGRLEMIKAGAASEVGLDEQRGFRFSPSETEVRLAESRTYYAFDPASDLFVYRDRGAMPYTRIVSYVRQALRHHPELEDVQIDFIPRRVERTVASWLEQFTTVSRVAVSYRHSRSPGELAIDEALEAMNAQEATESYTAAPTQSLNTQQITSRGERIGQAISHIEHTSTNGNVIIRGKVLDDTITVQTRDSVERHLLEVTMQDGGIVGALKRLMRGLTGSPND